WANWAYSSYANEIEYTKYKYAKFTNIWKFKVEPKTNNINDGEEVIVADGVYNIRTAKSAFFVNVKDNGTENTTNVNIRTRNNNGSQDFYIYRESNGWYKIRHIYSRKSLDVSGAVAGNGTNIQLWDDFDADAQRWKFYKTGDGLCLKNALGYYFDVAGGVFLTGTNIQTWEKNDTASQRFYLDKVSGYGMISYDVDVDLAIHRTMDYNSSSTIGTVAEGEIVRILERNGKYAYIKYRDIIDGWCSGKYVIDV
ncbi:MAG: RICIN domain-containing protein, partial [Oscillospiraceae bacterium]